MLFEEIGGVNRSTSNHLITATTPTPTFPITKLVLELLKKEWTLYEIGSIIYHIADWVYDRHDGEGGFCTGVTGNDCGDGCTSAPNWD